jgi:hypothetical protein
VRAAPQDAVSRLSGSSSTPTSTRCARTRGSKARRGRKMTLQPEGSMASQDDCQPAPWFHDDSRILNSSFRALGTIAFPADARRLCICSRRASKFTRVPEAVRCPSPAGDSTKGERAGLRYLGLPGCVRFRGNAELHCRMASLPSRTRIAGPLFSCPHFLQLKLSRLCWRGSRSTKVLVSPHLLQIARDCLVSVTGRGSCCLVSSCTP